VSFAQTAQGLLVTPEGKIDKQALSYLDTALKDKSVSALYAAYKDAKLTNQNERAMLMTAVLQYTGPSAEANEMFHSILVDETVPSGIRAFTIQGLAGGAGRERPSDPRLIEARLSLLRNYRGSLKDERLLRAIDDTKVALEKILQGQQ
jgi:hypothetical protein